MKHLICAIVLLGCTSSWAITVSSTVYILRDSITFEDGVKFPYATFNETPSFSATNARLEINQGDQLDLWVVNFDAITHQFELVGESTVFTILAGDSVQLSFIGSTAGVYLFRDPTNFPDYAATGLGGMLVVKNHNHSSFYWNLKEHQAGYNEAIFAGGSVNWGTYYPEYFTINSHSNPSINADPSARITGNVGDTIIVYVVNTGQSVHSIHFHGYHLTILDSSKNPLHNGRLKDSLPIYPFETLVLQLVPDKPGEYPVHDHNLIGTSGGSVYPLGMFTTLLIAP